MAIVVQPGTRYAGARRRVYYTPSFDFGTFHKWKESMPAGAWSVLTEKYSGDAIDAGSGNIKTGYRELIEWARDNGFEVSRRSCPGVRPYWYWIKPRTDEQAVFFILRWEGA